MTYYIIFTAEENSTEYTAAGFQFFAYFEGYFSSLNTKVV